MPIPAWNATPHRLFLLLLVQLILLSCQRTPPVLPVAPTTRPPTLTLGPRTENLLHPRRIDWATQQISAPSLVAQRQSWLKQLADERDQSSYRLQAWPDPAASWTVSGNSYPGITLSALSNVATLSGVALGSNDIVTNGAASTLVASNDPNELHNRVFFLTKEGRLLKLKRDNPLDTPRGLNLNKTFSSTYVSLSPRCSRAYLLADDGTFFVVDTRGATMTVQCSTDIGGGGSTSEGEGIAPTLDPIVSNDADHQDIVYVPRNDGHVFKYTITPTTSSLSGTDYTVATATAIVDSTYNPSGHKIFSPCVVLDGKIMLGDGAGYFHYFNTSTSTDKTYAISTRGILTPPAIEIQDGSYTGLTDANGNSTTVATNAPLYAFVNVTRKNGPVCAWINLASDDVWYSRPLYLDDHDTTDRYGAWFAYDYSASDTDRIMTADDSLNAASDYATNLPGATQTYSSDHLSPALGNVNLNTTPVTSFSVSPAPEDVVVDKDGKIWVSHPSTNQVKRYSKTGTLENTYSVTSQPEGIAYDRTNNYIWVSNANDAANADGTQDVHRINVNTNATAVFDVAYKKPNDVAVGPDGSVWVSADTGTQIAKLDSNGTKLANYEIGFTHKGVAVDPSGNAVWVTVSDAGTVQLARIDVASGTVKTFNNSNANGTNYSPGSAPTAIDVTSQGSIWVAYPSANTLKHYSWPGGNALTTLATITATGCKGIVVDNSDGVWVTCSNNTVQRILNNAISGSVTVGNDARGIDIGPFGLACANAGSSTISIFGSSNSTGV
ncbi:MAG: NHL repeat-containing protein, partial [Candidatus Sericytochromatia bacterium]|nr:NHL repeat-containing protein [Candidatus Sericytochromatia bacterium]